MSLVVLFVVAVLIVAAIGIWLVLASRPDSVEVDEQVSTAWRDDLFRNRREDRRED